MWHASVAQAWQVLTCHAGRSARRLLADRHASRPNASATMAASVSVLGQVLGQEVVPDDQPGSVELSWRSGRAKNQTCGCAAPSPINAVDVSPRDVRQGLAHGRRYACSATQVPQRVRREGPPCRSDHAQRRDPKSFPGPRRKMVIVPGRLHGLEFIVMALEGSTEAVAAIDTFLAEWAPAT